VLVTMPNLCSTLLAGLSLAAATTTPSCKSDSGSNVDFAYAFKYPKSYNYAYMDSKTKLTKSSHTLDSTTSSISKTIMQMHESGVNVVMWNDQPTPKGDSQQPHAHSKGLLIFTSSGGIWLTHSLPHFPAHAGTSASDLWRDASNDFGQAFLCITVTAAEIHKLSPVMKITWPVVYYTQGSLTTTWADVKEWAVDNKHNSKNENAAMTTHVSIKSKGGQTFTLFAKSGYWGIGKDLYRDLVAPNVGSLDMEGWRRGAGVWDAACGKDQVLDITEVKFPEESWPTTDDHSKWAVAETGTTFCVGDINRADGQDRRGGGTVCIKSSSFASQMRKVISTTDKCSKDIVQI